MNTGDALCARPRGDRIAPSLAIIRHGHAKLAGIVIGAPTVFQFDTADRLPASHIDDEPLIPLLGLAGAPECVKVAIYSVTGIAVLLVEPLPLAVGDERACVGLGSGNGK